MDTISRLSLAFAIAGSALAGGGQLAGLGAATTSPWAMAIWILGCPLIFVAILLPLVPRWLDWSNRRYPDLPTSLALVPFCAVAISALIGLGFLMVRLMP